MPFPTVSADLTKFRLAPAAVFYDGVYIGEVSYEDPVEILDDVSEVPLKSARLGTVDASILDHECFVNVPVVEVTPDKLAKAIPGSDYTAGVLTVKQSAGILMRQFSAELIVVRLVAGVPSEDPNDAFTFPEASPAPGSVSQKFTATKQDQFTIKFRIWPAAGTGTLYTVGG
jgi:hypothetical protein